MKKVLTIAGSDSSGGAGIQADIKTMTVLGTYAMSCICALTAQNTLGVYDILEVTPSHLHEQLKAVFEDIFPDAIKIGMVFSSGLAHQIAEDLKHYNAQNIVLDPVMVSTSGKKLICDDAIETIKSELFPLARVITPNIPEGEELSGMKISNEADLKECAGLLGEKYSVAVLLKGGHLTDTANDYLYENGEFTVFKSNHIATENTHGTGCTLSSAIAAHLAKGEDLKTAVRHAKEYICGALNDGMDIGHGNGPLNHGYLIKG